MCLTYSDWILLSNSYSPSSSCCCCSPAAGGSSSSSPPLGEPVVIRRNNLSLLVVAAPFERSTGDDIAAEGNDKGKAVAMVTIQPRWTSSPKEKGEDEEPPPPRHTHRVRDRVRL